MVAPKLSYAAAIGQTSVRAVFDRPMKELGPDSPYDPENPTLWTSGNGLPEVTTVVRHSMVEFELLLIEPAPIGSGYSITVADTVQSADGETIDAAFTSLSFDVTVPDLIVEGVSWISSSIFDLIFSAPLQDLFYESYSEILTVQPANGGRMVQVVGLEQSGPVLRVTLANPGTAGAQYLVSLVRDLFVAQGTNVVLKQGDQNQTVWGQGQPGYVASSVATETSFRATFSEPLNYGSIDPQPGLPLFPGAYLVSSGALGAKVEAGATPAVVSFPEARFQLGNVVQWLLSRTTREVTAGQSFISQASSVVGAVSESLATGSTTFTKNAGSPYEVVFSGGLDSLVRAGRTFATTIRFEFTPSNLSYPLIAFTFLNTQTSVVFSKREDNQVSLRIYCGSNPVGDESQPFDPSLPMAIEVIDATADQSGFFAVKVNGVVVAGAESRDILVGSLIDQNAGVTAVAFTLGSPYFESQSFSVTFTENVVVNGFLTTGLRGQNSRDLVSFSGSETTVIAGISPNAPASPGFMNTGKAAFGVMAEYMPAVDAIQVVIGLNEEATITSFTGSISLLTGQQDVLDQVQFDQYCLLIEDKEVIAVFLHPKMWAGVQVGVVLDIGNSSYSAMVPVITAGQSLIQAKLTQQPASWYHKRLPSYPAAVAAYGPAVLIS